MPETNGPSDNPDDPDSNKKNNKDNNSKKPEGTDDFDVAKFLRDKKRIENSGTKGHIHFAGETYVYKKNSWRGYGLIPQKSPRVWARLPHKVERKPTEYQRVMRNIMKSANERPEMRLKTGQERIQIRRLIRERLLEEVREDTKREDFERIIDECVRSIGKNSP